MKRTTLFSIVLILLLSGCTPDHQQITTLYNGFVPLSIAPQSHPVGVQIEGESLNGRGIYLAPGSTVKVSVNWNRSEKIPGVYTFPPILTELADYPLIVSVKNAPPWARRNGPQAPECYGVDPGHYSDLASFLDVLVARFPNIIAIELWNEPDTPAEIMNPLAYPYYGCIGDGQVYGEMVCAVSPIFRAAHPEIVILAGAMADPEAGDFLANFSNACQDYDVASYHQYEWTGFTRESWIAETQASLIASVTHKPVTLTETSLRCTGNCPGFEQQQAEYFRWASQLPFPTIWYTLADNGWDNTDLCWQGLCRPAWNLYISSWR